MQGNFSGIWIQFSDSIFYSNNHYTTDSLIWYTLIDIEGGFKKCQKQYLPKQIKNEWSINFLENRPLGI